MAGFLLLVFNFTALIDFIKALLLANAFSLIQKRGYQLLSFVFLYCAGYLKKKKLQILIGKYPEPLESQENTARPNSLTGQVTDSPLIPFSTVEMRLIESSNGFQVCAIWVVA